MIIIPIKNDEGHKKYPHIFYFCTILIPILFFLLLEFFLFIINYGNVYPYWVETNDGQSIVEEGKYLLLNPNIARKYFHHNKNVPMPCRDPFDKIKKRNSFRIFILGGSSAAGFPFEPTGAFSKYLKLRLSLVYPNTNFEVINCSMSAINSYTLNDIAKGIVTQKPDIVLIYAGHNEYYGALGVESRESLGNSFFLTNLLIKLENYRTYQLLRNFIYYIEDLLGGDKAELNGTLMQRMANEKIIPYKSDIYNNGLAQFRYNLEEIIELFNDENIPVIIGKLVCNLKDQPPFISDSSDYFPPAELIYNKAHNYLININKDKADSLFRYAKDLDVLRFRAPKEINDIISDLGYKYNISVLDIDSALSDISPHKIIGNNLMIDHLHLTLQGYQIIGKLFYEKIVNKGYLSDLYTKHLPADIQDSITLANFNFSILDSTMAAYKISVLKNNWPYVKNNKVFSYDNIFHPINIIDTLSLLYVKNELNWIDAHLYAAQWYLNNNNIEFFKKEMDVIISVYPYNIEYLNSTAKILLKLNDFKNVFEYLDASYKLKPSSFNSKWLAISYRSFNKIDSSRHYSLISLNFDNRDAQVWFNLATTYINEDKRKAIELLDKSLSLSPNYKYSIDLKNYLLK